MLVANHRVPARSCVEIGLALDKSDTGIDLEPTHRAAPELAAGSRESGSAKRDIGCSPSGEVEPSW